MKRALTGKHEVSNAERDCHRKFASHGFSLPLAIQSIHHEVSKDLLVTNWVKVSHWLGYLLNRMPCVLGNAKISLQDQCQVFWDVFRHHEPEHIIFQSGKDLRRSLPLCLYGDEGRGPKRAQYLEISWETAFGVVEQTGTCGCREHLQRAPASAIPSSDAAAIRCKLDGKVSTSLKGHSYLTKHLIFGMPSYQYKKQPMVLSEHLRLLCEDMQFLFDHGIHVGDSTWYGIVIAVKGDMKFHCETVCRFTRSYATLGQRANQLMCPFCHAGHEDFPMEEVDHEPAWARTWLASRPWSADDVPELASLPYDSLGRQERMFKLDLFHLGKVGLSRHVVGSLVVSFARLGLFDSEGTSHDINVRLDSAHGHFKLFCLQMRKSPGLRSFTPAFMNCKTQACSPWSNSKGSDTTLLLKWISFFTGLILATQPGFQHEYLKTAKTVADSILEVHKICESHGLFLDKTCAQLLYVKLMTVAKGYHKLAKQILDLGMVGFSIVPKYHGIKHVAYEIRKTLRTSSRVLNPNFASCESNEDHVGKISSLARKVSTRTIGFRVIQRYFLKSRALFFRHRKAHGKGLL